MTLSPTLVLLLVAAVAAQRLGELVLARHWLRRTAQATGASVPRDPTYPWMVALHAAWLAGCAAEPLLAPRAVWPPLALSMAGLWAAAMLLRVWTLRTLGRYWHVRVVERRTQPVRSGGPYRWLRHPNYLVVIVELAVVPLLLGAWVTALLAGLANAALLAARIRREEAYLMALPEYRAAFAHKARLLPGIF